jgi:hypothetical protein
MRSLATMLAVTATIGAVAGPAAARPADARPVAPVTAPAYRCPVPAAVHAAWARGDFAPASPAKCASAQRKVCPINNPAFSAGGGGGVSAATIGGAGLLVVIAAALVIVAVSRRRGRGRGPAPVQSQS